MNKRIVFLTEKDAMYGFRLAGFEHHVCTSGELESLLHSLARNNTIGIFVIDERLVTETMDKRLREMERSLGLVMVIMPPPIEVETKREDYGARLLRKAIGYHIKLNI